MNDGLSLAVDVPEWVDVSRDDFGASWFVTCSRCESGTLLYTTHVLETKGEALRQAIEEHADCEDGDGE